jgi:hypothetical protein
MVSHSQSSKLTIYLRGTGAKFELVHGDTHAAMKLTDSHLRIKNIEWSSEHRTLLLVSSKHWVICKIAL